MSKERNQFNVEVLHELGERVDLAPLADALLLLRSEPALDTALSLAQNLKAAAYQYQARRHALNAAADDLRARLAQIEDQLRQVA
jgi:hypothetical protein